MFLRMSKVVPLILSLLIAIPAAAGERHAGNRFPNHRGIHNGGHEFVLGQRSNGQNRGLRLAATDERRGGHDRDRVRLLKQFHSRDTRYVRNNVIIVQQAQGGYAGGTYAGSSYAYDVAGGTYVGGDSYGFYRGRPVERLAPKAKVIDVASSRSPCSYEAGVCVIRP